MRSTIYFKFLAILSCISAILLSGCGSGHKEGAEQPIAQPQLVGSQSCISCHTTILPVDLSGNNIVTAWQGTTHTTDGNVQCEDCHGAGGFHHGVGPIPYPNPMAAQCARCHTTINRGTAGQALAEFNATAHANGNNVPDGAFSQLSTPVSSGRHIQECSVCHNSNQRFDFDSSGNLLKPSPTNLPQPVVSCASCHDGHQTEQKVAIAQRLVRIGYPLFRSYIVNASGAQSVTGTRQAAIIFQPNGAALPAPGSAPGTEVTPDYGLVIGTNNEVNPDLLCAACHTKGTYRNSGGPTHQPDIHTQWTNSGHGDRNAAAFGEFSANPPAYGFTDLGHRTTYPVDMALSTVGATARPTTSPTSTARNGSFIPAGSTRLVNNFACFKCHNGLTSIAYQDNVEGTGTAPVVFGDATVTCITCHSPHRNTPGNTSNTRKPVLMTKYTSGITIIGNVFLDNSPVPAATGNATICIYCHQGRESGLTLYVNRLAPTVPAATLDQSFFNPHYLGTGAMLWGVNGYEYTGKSYSANTAHQGANCTTCHMANPTTNNLNGGHTWSPNVATCNTSSCHGGGVGPAVATTGTASPDVTLYRAAFDANDYDGDGNNTESIADEIMGLQANLIGLLALNGIYYDDLNYPYVFNDPLLRATANQFTAWSTTTGGRNAYKAAFNLQFIIKGLPSDPLSQATVPNASAAVHNYKYAIQLLRDAYEDYRAVAPNTTGFPALAGTRPAGTRAARVYGSGQ